MATQISGIQTGGSGGGGDDLFTAILDKSVTAVQHSTLTEIGQYSLRDCKSLTTVDVPAVTEIGSYAFYNCSKLASVNVPLAETIGQYAFYGCTELKSLNFPSAKSLSSRAVSSSNLEMLDLGVCTSLDANSLNGCSSLDTIILRSTTLCSLGDVTAFTNTCFAYGKAGGTIYVPSSLLNSYKTATNWSAVVGYGTLTFVAIEGSEYE